MRAGRGGGGEGVLLAIYQGRGSSFCVVTPRKRVSSNPECVVRIERCGRTRILRFRGV